MIQGRIIFGRRFLRASSIGRARNKNQTILLTTDAMTLVGGGDVSRWRSLVWFWCGIAAFAVVGVALLALLGAPSEHDERMRTAAQPPTERTLPVSPKAPMQRVSERSDQPEVSVPKQATPMPAAPPVVPQPAPPDPPPRSKPTLPPEVLAPISRAPDSIGQQNAPPRSRIVMVVHPARPEGGGAIAERLATRAGLAAEQFDMGTTAEARSDAAIRFYSESDHALARRLGRELAGMGYTWKLENYSQRAGASRDQAIEVFLPNR